MIRDQWKTLEIDLLIYGQLIVDQDAKIIQIELEKLNFHLEGKKKGFIVISPIKKLTQSGL